MDVPDIGLVTLAELADHVAAIADAVEFPILVDADTGFGNPLNVMRSVRLLERAGAAGIQLEDQVFPKKCGHFAGKQVIARAEMVGKIKAACDARHDGDLQIVARTDARAIEGIDAAIDRAQAYVEAGADATFVEAPLDAAELRADRARACRSADRQHGVRRAHAAGLTRRTGGAWLRRRALCQCGAAGGAEGGRRRDGGAAA